MSFPRADPRDTPRGVKHRMATQALSKLSSSLADQGDKLLLFSSWVNKLADMPEDYFPEGGRENELHLALREIIQELQDEKKYRFYADELMPSDETVREWIRENC